MFFLNAFNNLFAFEIVNIRFGLDKNIQRIVIDVSENTTFNYKIVDKKLKIIFGKKLVKGVLPKIEDKELINSVYFNKEKNQINFSFKKKITLHKTFFIKRDKNKSPRVVIDIKVPDKIKKEKRIIVIDAGHGGKDSGAVGLKKILEKDITLIVARKLKNKIEKTTNYKAILTRNSDVYLKLRNRVKIARNLNADLFISLHADYHRNKKVSGVSIYTLSEKASDKEAEALARRENKEDLIEGLDLSTESKEVRNILIDLTQRETMNQSSYFVDFLIKEFKTRTRLLQRTHRFAGFAVLKAPDVPSVLIEMGYLSNKKDSNLLLNNKYHEKIINSIVNGVKNYFNWVDENSLNNNMRN